MAFRFPANTSVLKFKCDTSFPADLESNTLEKKALATPGLNDFVSMYHQWAGSPPAFEMQTNVLRKSTPGFLEWDPSSSAAEHSNFNKSCACKAGDRAEKKDKDVKRGLLNRQPDSVGQASVCARIWNGWRCLVKTVAGMDEDTE
eukprot:TRINITY_DN14123_c0_g1_i2.p2 TRINITY_DN14123_c0_g1~~TRINITY_DN14123_c0_g1_i2.p2  ORF type:complete len:145 (-),score=25.19 TRINITY_DN14123_c0_g1_i2:254-688(-)